MTAYTGDDVESNHDVDQKIMTEFLEEPQIGNHNVPNKRLEAPPLIRVLTAEDRVRAERALVRKIDLRLMPSIILMYIMVCTGRTNERFLETDESRTTWTATTLPLHDSQERRVSRSA